MGRPKVPTANALCNPERFQDRVFLDENFNRSLCRCCGKVMGRAVTNDVNEMDGWCRYCERGHVRAPHVERPRLFPTPAPPSAVPSVSQPK